MASSRSPNESEASSSGAKLQDDKHALANVLREVSDNLERIVQQARLDILESIDEFISKRISKLFQIVDVYKKAFENLQAKTREEFERKARHHFRDKDIREGFDELLQNEHEWDDMLQDVDKVLTESNIIALKEGDEGPVSVEVVDARTAKVSLLNDFLDEIKQAGGKMLIVSFGEAPGAKKWLQETECPFDMVLDSERKIYHAFGLTRSLFKVWSISCMTYYTEQILMGRQLPKPYENVHDDPQQMGGDFILDGQGVIKLSYCSKTSSDRPSVDLLLSTLRKS